MVRTCGMSISDVHPLAFPGNANPQALVAGQLKVSVLQLNEFVAVQSQGKKLTTVLKMSQAVPDTMSEMYGTTKIELAKKRSTFVKFIAARIATIVQGHRRSDGVRRRAQARLDVGVMT